MELSFCDAYFSSREISRGIFPPAGDAARDKTVSLITCDDKIRRLNNARNCDKLVLETLVRRELRRKSILLEIKSEYEYHLNFLCYKYILHYLQ